MVWSDCGRHSPDRFEWIWSRVGSFVVDLVD